MPRTQSIFKFGTHGYMIDMNRHEIRKMRDRLWNMVIGEARSQRQAAVAALDALLAQMNREVEYQADTHPGDCIGSDDSCCPDCGDPTENGGQCHGCRTAERIRR